MSPEWFATLASSARSLVDVLGREALYSTVVFTFVLCLGWLPRRLGWSSLSHALWALVLLRLVLPTDLSMPWSARSILDRSVLSARVGGVDAELRTVARAVGEEDREGAFAGRAGNASATAGAVAVALAIAWGFGVVVLAGLLLRKRRSYQDLVRRAQPLGEARLQALLERWREELGIRRGVRLLGCEARVSPFTVGLGRPVIVLPRSLVDHPDRRLAECALAHELVHVKRWDDGWLALQSILQVLYFFHPVVWVSCYRLNEERERICDDLVLARGLVGAATYARSLVAVLKLQLTPLGPVPAFGNRKRRFMMRLEDIQSRKHRFAAHPMVPMVFALLLGGFLLPMAATGDPPQAAVADEPPAGEQSSTAAMSLINPLPQGRVTSGFGPRIDYLTRKRVHHQGIDVAAKLGTPILAPAPGVVETATEQYAEGERFGTVVVLDHGNGFKTLFSHLESFTVLVGQEVVPGDPIATVGSTGVSSGPHLHFEILRDGQPVDPGEYVAEWQGR